MSFSSGAVEKTGTIRLWGGDTAPYGWLLCDGSAISRTLYSELFNLVGTKWGVGDGTTTFNLPAVNFDGQAFIYAYIQSANVPVSGTGKALGLIGNKSDGTIKTVSLMTDSVGGLHSSTTAPESQEIADNPSPTYGSWGVKNGSGLGVSTDATKSGLKADFHYTRFATTYIIKY